MNQALLFIIVVIAAIGAAFVMINGDNNDINGGDDDTNGAQLEFVGNMESYTFNVYLSQKGSSERTLLDDGGTFDVPSSDTIIIIVAKNPTADISLDGNKILIPLSDETLKVNIGFQYAELDTPVLLDSKSAYYSFTPTADKINLGVFSTNY